MLYPCFCSNKIQLHNSVYFPATASSEKLETLPCKEPLCWTGWSSVIPASLNHSVTLWSVYVTPTNKIHVHIHQLFTNISTDVPNICFWPSGRNTEAQKKIPLGQSWKSLEAYKLSTLLDCKSNFGKARNSKSGSFCTKKYKSEPVVDNQHHSLGWISLFAIEIHSLNSK